MQSLQPVCTKQFGKSSPQGAAGAQKGKPSHGSYFGQVVLVTVSKVFRANIRGRLARKLILDLKARAENYRWAKTLRKKKGRKRRD